MKLYYAPSGKRMLPYPPVAPALLAASLRKEGVVARVIDLEIEAWLRDQLQGFWPTNRDILHPYRIIGEDGWSAELEEFACDLLDIAEYNPGEPIGISTMGYEQLASTMILVKKALCAGSRVILGGQFWTDSTAQKVLEIIRDTRLTIVTSDGYESIVEWHRGDSLPINALSWNGDTVAVGRRKAALTRAPTPEYPDCNWYGYDRYASKLMGATDSVRRAHLYVWDKQCPYKCTFCRVSAGSNVKLGAPEGVAEAMSDLLSLGVKQLNFMTNEINPTLSYMRRFVKALSPSLENKEDVSWFSYMRPDFAAPSDFADLRRVGCRLLRYGVETGSQRLSDLMRKDYKIPIIEETLKNASDAGIWNHVNFLIGFPGEVEEDIEQTLEFIDRVAPYLHSVRLNPFYLPPDSPMAREPEKSGVRLLEFKNGFWDFELLDGTRDEPATIEGRLNRISERVKSYGIGFAGVLPFETLDFLARYENRDNAIVEMQRERPYMWESSSADWLKGQLGAYEAPIEWKATIYKRGKNYSLALCND
ncbi:radical SAM protein (plasmid) [Rhizobium sp. CB3171]|uniref:B12-binding domain-containing radical SAM protein n=1 Tax=Rhizobium sp. CB3171 TaxID=3039157 RepID=UPI0024B0E8E1|nr:radical SAM protein [Rhizobium sp. CB3171]WFU04541.1 radical SAM protein [Rhizobium sp. CB3171]